MTARNLAAPSARGKLETKLHEEISNAHRGIRPPREGTPATDLEVGRGSSEAWTPDEFARIGTLNPVGADVRRRTARFARSFRLVTSAPTNLVGSWKAAFP